MREQATYFLINEYVHYVPVVAKKTGLAQDLALDVYTDALVDMMGQVANGTFKGESKLSTYLYQIFFFKCIDLSRKNTTNTIDYRAELPEVPAMEPSFARKMEATEAVGQLHKYMDVLGEPCKQILLDWGFWGYNMSEIAVRVGLEDSLQVKDRKYRCLKKLRKLME